MAQLPENLRVHGLGRFPELGVHRVLDFESLQDRGRAIHRKLGVFPISFSNPRAMQPRVGEALRFLSEVVPGEPYSFSSEDDYLRQYRESYFALSTKKAGWDCFRHLEIAFSGSIPLVPGLSATDPGIMFAYPKVTWSMILDELRLGGPQIPSNELLNQLQQYYETFLTSTAMAVYLLDVLEYQGGPVAFVDDSLDTCPDYQSIFTLVGLSRLLGNSLSLPDVPDYLTSTVSNSHKLYGRGFGYSGALQGLDKPEGEKIHSTTILNHADSFELIVFGHFFRDFPKVAEQVTRDHAMGKIVGILGDDYPVTPGTIRRLADSEASFFVRELQ